MLRIIGDVHGHVKPYMKLIKETESSVQLGDFGLKEEYRQLEWYFDQKPYDYNKHVIIPGNHDDYENLPESALGNYGYRIIDQIGYFWIRGAFSIDYRDRIEGVDWWRKEELTFIEKLGQNMVCPAGLECPKTLVNN